MQGILRFCFNSFMILDAIHLSPALVLVRRRFLAGLTVAFEHYGSPGIFPSNRTPWLCGERSVSRTSGKDVEGGPLRQVSLRRPRVSRPGASERACNPRST